MYRGCIAIRTIEAGDIGPWEWLNPPLQLGVEYRTVERYGGKPVYVMAVSLGTGPDANSQKTVYHNITNIQNIVDFGGGMVGSTGAISLPGVSSYNDDVYGFGVNYSAFIWRATSIELTGYTGTGWVKYTKTTD